jgi:CDP-diacylglycerol---serine O-phosphatidyltransferase
MTFKRALRYLAPNLVTTLSLVFGMLSIASAIEGRPVDAAWFIIYAVLTDRLDGFVARLVRGTSELGVQLDSFADFLNFGLAPAVLVYTTIGAQPSLPFTEGGARLLLIASCMVWVLSATFRLARYNITTEDAPNKIFFGVPTTLAAGTFAIWFLALTKYSDPASPLAPEADFGGARLFGDLTISGAIWPWVPAAMFVGAFLMASSLRMPKLGVMRSKAATIFVLSNVGLGYIFGFARLFPEYLVWPPTIWLVTFLVWGQFSREAQGYAPPPIFPPVDPPPGQEPVRPEDDLLPEGETAGLDENDEPA